MKRQDPVTGAFAGNVSENGDPSKPVAGAEVVIENVQNNAKYRRVTDISGGFYVGRLSPGVYKITVTRSGYEVRSFEQRLLISQVNTVQPVPVNLKPLAPSPILTTGPTPTPDTAATGGTQPTTSPSPEAASEEERVNLQVGRLDGRRGGGYSENQVATLPLGAATYVRTFDELALLLPGVVLPPYSLGTIAGPGVAPGVGSAGQFSVNGLPPRANNFTVDGSDNNDEDIGVRRQGFLSLVPQPVESIKEYQVITLLAPAQFGRNIGAQVNAVSKSGGNDVHGDLYGFFNSSQLNSRNVFDTEDGGGPVQLTTAATTSPRPVNRVCTANSPTNCVAGPINVDRSFGGEDSSTLGQFGFTLGGPIKKERWFYFLSGERQVLNASQERSFAVPTIEQRGFGLPPNVIAPGVNFNPLAPTNGSGATGFERDPLLTQNDPSPNASFTRVIPQTLYGAAIFSLFPFPNNPNGVYGANTFTQVLPASGKGGVASGKIDYVNSDRRLFQSFTTRYNFTQDWRDIPAAGGAIFAALRPATRTQNISTFLNSEFSGKNAGTQVYNQVRLSYGRTRLRFDELRDPSLLPSNFGGGFLLNAPLLQGVSTSTTGPVPYTPIATFTNVVGTPGSGVGAVTTAGRCLNGATPNSGQAITTECLTGPLGQVVIGGFSPVGVDVFNFPQRRVNNTYQLADTMTIRQSGRKEVTYTFGADMRRTELNSALPRNARPLVAFSGSPALRSDPRSGPFGCGGICEVTTVPYIPPTWFAAAGVPSGVFQALSVAGNESGNIGLRYYQWNFFGQEDFRLTNSLSLTLGVRYEYNTPVREVNDLIERFYTQRAEQNPLGINFPRTSLYDPDRNNLAPRIGVAWAPKVFGAEHPTVIRGGFGVYYDQIIGSVASQSRNVFPGFLPLNVSGAIDVGALNQQFSNQLNSTQRNQVLAAFTGTAISPRSLSVGTINPNSAGGQFLGPCIFPINPFCIGPYTPLTSPNSLNTLNSAFDPNNPNNHLGDLIQALRRDLGSAFSFTLPSRTLQMPMAYQYSYTLEQGLPNNMLLSFGYVGTRGRNLLRITTPNNGPNNFPILGIFSLSAGSNSGVNVAGFQTGANGQGVNAGAVLSPRRPTPLIGSPYVIETTGRSQYDAIQVQLRGRLARERAFLYQIGYSFSKARDSVSDVFDLAGASALPQQSTTLSSTGQTTVITGGLFPGEYARSNYDTPHRVSYDLVWDLIPGRSGLQLASTGMFQSGQPFTVNSIIDINADGNLTDRLNTTNGLNLNGSDRQPLQLTTSNTRSLLAQQNFNAALPRNSFRAGTFRLVNLTAIKKFSLGETTGLSARLDVFNLLNRDNFNIPVRILESPGFGSATETVTPGRRLQFGLKLTF